MCTAFAVLLLKCGNIKQPLLLWQGFRSDLASLCINSTPTITASHHLSWQEEEEGFYKFLASANHNVIPFAVTNVIPFAVTNEIPFAVTHVIPYANC